MPDPRPSFFALLWDAVRAPIERRALAAAQARVEAKGAAVMERQIEMLASVVEPEPDEANWKLIGGQGTRTLNEPQAATLREEAQRAALISPHLSGYLNTLERFVMGKGATLAVVHETPAVAEAAGKHWDRFRLANHWDQLEDEIPLRLWRDGEVFIRRFDRPAVPVPSEEAQQQLAQWTIKPPSFAPADPWPAGVPVIRCVPPEQIQSPMGSTAITHGIVTAKDDAQLVLGYVRSVDGKRADEYIPAADMIHQKVRADADVKRGRSLLEPLLKRNAQFEQWLNHRIVLNFVRSAVALVKTVDKATPSQLQAMRDAQATQRDTGNNDRQVRAFKPGTTITAPAGVKYDFINPNLNAQDARYDGRAILLSMAAASGMAEFIFTGDASNANYASTMVTESPTMRECEHRQDQLEPTFIRVFRWNLIHGARTKQIPGLTEEEARTIPIAVTWPALQSRNEREFTERNRVLHDAGILSDESWAAAEGLDWATEKERLDAEREKKAARAPAVPPDPADA